MFFRGLILSVMCNAILVGCTSKLYVPTEYDAMEQNISLEMLLRGRTLYIKKCGGCHNLYLPEKYPINEWPRIIEKMKKDAGIDNTQAEQILDYLRTGIK